MKDAYIRERRGQYFSWLANNESPRDEWSDTQRKDEERTYNKSGAGFQKDHGEMIELVWTCDEERRRTHTEKSVDDGYTREKEDGTTEYKMEIREPT